MTDRTQQEIDISAVFDAFVYLDDQQENYEGATLKYIMTEIGKKYELLTEEKKQYYNDIQAAIARMPELENYELASQSSQASKIPTDLLFACTFKSQDDDYYVAYRGTGDGKWLDNGEGMYKEDTIMQRKAVEYFDSVISKEELNSAHNIVVTGHSKGGNSAQYVTLAAHNASLIDSCYSFDGQGFSEKAQKTFERQLKNQYQTQIDKMYSINGENDYVHDLGIAVIPSDRTYFVATPDGTSIGGMHGLQYMIVDGEIVLDLANPVQQGPMGEFAKKLSAEMMELSDEDLEDCALSIMSLIERFMNGGEVYMEGTGDEKFADVEEFCGFISVGIPLIFKTAIATDEGRAAVGSIAMDTINGLASDEKGKWMIAGIAALALACAPAVVTLGKVVIAAGSAVWASATLIDSVLGVFDDTLELSDIGGAAIIAHVIAKAAVLLASNPHIIPAVLAIATVVAFVTYVVQHWDEIKAFIKSAGDYFVGLATALYSWAENLVKSTVNLVKAAIKKAVGLYQNVKHAIVDFGNRLMSEAVNFFNKISQTVIGFLGSITQWAKGLFGSASSVLGQANQIVVTISRIEEMQRRMGTLRSTYLDAVKAVNGAEAVVRKVYSYYDESYVRSCCRDVQNDLKNAQKYLNSLERELDRKRRTLAAAVDAYHKADQSAAREIRKVTVNLTDKSDFSSSVVNVSKDTNRLVDFGKQDVIQSFGNVGSVFEVVNSIFKATTWNDWANVGLSAGNTIAKIAKDYKNYNIIGRAIGAENATAYFWRNQLGLNNVGYASKASSPTARFYNNLHNTTSAYNLSEALAPLTGSKGVGTTIAAWAGVALSGIANVFSNVDEQKESNGTMSTGRVVAETISETAIDTAVTYAGTAIVGAAITAATGVVAAPVAVAAATGVAIAGINAGVEALTGKSATEWVSDAVLDTASVVGNAVVNGAKAVANWFGKLSFA